MKTRKWTARASLCARIAAGFCVVMLLQLEVGALFMRGSIIAEAYAAEVAARKMAVLVVPKSRKDKNASRDLEFMLRGFLRRLQDVKPVDMSPPANTGDEAKLAGEVEQAFRSLMMRKPLDAKRTLDAVAAKLKAQPATGDVRFWAKYYKAWALTELGQNKLLEASNNLVKSLTLFRKQTDAEYVAYGMRARQLLRTVMSAVDRQDTGDLEVKGGTKGAEIWLDGKFVGRSPTTVPDVKAGLHRISLRKSGMAAAREMVTIQVNKTTTFGRKLKRAKISLDLAQGRELLRANFKKLTLVEDRIRELKTNLGADMMMVVQAKTKKTSTQFTGYFLDAEGGFTPVATELAKDLDYMDNMASFVAQSAAVTLTADSANRPLDPRSVVFSHEQAKLAAARAKAMQNGEGGAGGIKELTEKWWFWPAVGGAVVVIGTVTYLIFSGDDAPPPDPTGTLSLRLHRTSGK